MPVAFKLAYVTPLLKKPGLDCAEASSYRPISNLSIVSKLLERIVYRQVSDFLHGSDMLPRLQSAYRAHHSTETAILKVLSDILLAVDSGDLSVLALLDLSAAFDTVDHDILLQRLSTSYGIRGKVLDWFRSYLTGRVQCVRCGLRKSKRTMVLHGVPQGSVLGPLLFILYTADLIGLIEGYGLRPHLYADDTQIQGACSPDSTDQLQLTLSACLDDVSGWMQANRLQLNTAKTEILWCATSRRRHQLPTTTTRVCNDHVTPSTTVRDLGIYIDSDITMRSHVTRTVSSCFAVLRQLRSIRRSVPDTVFQSLVVSLVLSRLDYGNATLAGLPANQHRRLQSVMNAAARLIHRSSRFDHVTPLLRDLHWLKSPERVDFKLAVIVYRCMHGLAPVYLTNCIQRVADTNCRRLRSSSSSALVVPRTRLVTVGDRAFPVSGGRVWNSLPCNVVSAPTLSVFRNRLKTYLFSRSYP
ncbi:MAG TPA: reverse transcriptase family protein [Methylomicrobium sp.]|nr:reverse transcriptase family protein [Methylomicrobium sp.]